MSARVWPFVLLMPIAAGAAELRDVRVWAGPEGTRVVFDLGAAADHNLFTLSNPDRVVIDLADTRRASGIAATIEGRGWVRRVRSAPREGGALRLVLDLSEPIKPKSFALEPNGSYGHRIVVDLNKPGAAALMGPPAPPVTADPGKPIVIAIDAGHGGEDPGTQSRSGILEKDVALAMARRLARLVNQEPGYRAVLIRDGDYYIRLKERIRMARAAEADLFVSIHANSFHDPGMHGTAVYVVSPKGATSEHARMVANRENMADLIGGVDLRENDETTTAVLIDIMQSSAMEASYDVGDRLLSAMREVNTLQKPRVQQAGFTVLKSPDIPSVLVETAFLSNAREARLLADGQYQERMARSMLNGIRSYFRNYRPQQQLAMEPGSLESGAAAP